MPFESNRPTAFPVGEATNEFEFYPEIQIQRNLFIHFTVIGSLQIKHEKERENLEKKRRRSIN